MWKLLIGFVLFAALAMYILTKSGADVDMGGEKHDVSAGAAEHGASTASSAASAASK